MLVVRPPETLEPQLREAVSGPCRVPVRADLAVGVCQNR